MFFHDIQFLRSISIILVVFHHLNIYKSGYIGVDALFVITGFLMAMVTEKSSSNYLTFISNRILRTFPSMYIVLFTFLYMFRHEEKENFISITNEVKYGMLFIANIYYKMKESDYFHPSSSSKFLHIWAISVEMQFYIFCQILMLYRKINILLITMSILYYVYKNITLYYSLLGRLFQFSMGIELYWLRTEYKYSHVYKLIILVMFIFFPYQQLFKYSHLFSTLIVSLYLYLDSNLLDNIVMNNVAKISYSIYLIHYPMMFFVNNKLYYIILLYSVSYILTSIDNQFYSIMKNKTIYILIIYSLSIIMGIF